MPFPLFACWQSSAPLLRRGGLAPVRAQLGHVTRSAQRADAIALDRFPVVLAVEFSTYATCQLQKILKLQNLDYRFL